MSLQYAYILALIQGIREYLDGVLNFGLAYSFVFVDEWSELENRSALLRMQKLYVRRTQVGISASVPEVPLLETFDDATFFLYISNIEKADVI